MTRLMTLGIGTLGIASVLAVATLAPASATTRRPLARAPIDRMYGPMMTAPVYGVPGPYYYYGLPPGFGPNSCISDEGYGRFSHCDSGGTSN